MNAFLRSILSSLLVMSTLGLGSGLALADSTKVVYHDILMDGAKDAKSGTDYAPLVGALKSRGVRFEVCEITLRNRSLKKEQFTLDAEFTPSGVVRIADLQYKDKYAYIRP